MSSISALGRTISTPPLSTPWCLFFTRATIHPTSPTSTFHGCTTAWLCLSLNCSSIRVPMQRTWLHQTNLFRCSLPVSQQHCLISHFVQCPLCLRSWRAHWTRYLWNSLESLSTPHSCNQQTWWHVTIEANIHLPSPVQNDNKFTFLREICATNPTPHFYGTVPDNFLSDAPPWHSPCLADAYIIDRPANASQCWDSWMIDRSANAGRSRWSGPLGLVVDRWNRW